MKILVLGASGFTGTFLLNYFRTKAEVYGTYCTNNMKYENDDTMIHYDLEKEGSTKGLLDKVHPDVIISCLRGDFKLQLQAHKAIVSYLKMRPNSKLVYLSTSNVFDHDLSKPHMESDPTESESSYGIFKEKCEKLILDSINSQALIFRPSFILGKGCRRTTKLLEQSRNKEPIEIYENVKFNYTPVIQIAQWIEYLLEHDMSGIYHVGTKDTCSYAAFTKQLLNELHLPEPIFDGKVENSDLYQAVISERDEIPEELQYTIKNCIDYLNDEIRGCFQ